MTTKTVNFIFAESTKGAHKFNEVDSKGKVVKNVDGAIGTLYVRKTYLGETPPTKMTVTLEYVDPTKVKAKGAKKAAMADADE